MAYIIIKKSRVSNSPYNGPTCDRAGIERGKIYHEKRKAQKDAITLSKYNPVGFKVKVLKDI